MLSVPEDGASVKVRVCVPFTVYALNGSCWTLLTITSMSEGLYTALDNVTVVALPLPLNLSVRDVND
jgi:hypothetical protein